MLHDKENAVYLVGCASELLDACRRRWESRDKKGEHIDWPRLADLCYWRFCRFASSLSGTIIELGSPPEETRELAEIIQTFVDLTEDMLQTANGLSHEDVDYRAVEQIQRASLHCKERAEWLHYKASESLSFDEKVDKLSRMLASA